jgi:hypothetical protein
VGCLTAKSQFACTSRIRTPRKAALPARLNADTVWTRNAALKHGPFYAAVKLLNFMILTVCARSDVGSTQHLENHDPARPPITINYAIGAQTIKMMNYSICKVDAPKTLVNPNFQSFVINANNPNSCPIFFRDNKSPPQRYTFTITQPPPFTFFANPAVPPLPMWTPQTASVIDCSGNAGPPPYQQSSKDWCCELLAQAPVTEHGHTHNQRPSAPTKVRYIPW